MAKSACIIPITNSTNMEKLGQYRKTLAEFFCIGRVVLYWPSSFFFSLNWLNFHFVFTCDTL